MKLLGEVLLKHLAKPSKAFSSFFFPFLIFEGTFPVKLRPAATFLASAKHDVLESFLLTPVEEDLFLFWGLRKEQPVTL